jgi:hypothetical protein
VGTRAGQSLFTIAIPSNPSKERVLLKNIMN